MNLIDQIRIYILSNPNVKIADLEKYIKTQQKQLITICVETKNDKLFVILYNPYIDEYCIITNKYKTVSIRLTNKNEDSILSWKQENILPKNG